MEDYQERLYLARVYRLAFGLALSVAVAFGIGWPLSFLCPMLVCMFIGAPAPRPTFVALLIFPILIFAAFVLAIFVSSVTLAQPVLAIVANMLMVFWCFYLLARGVARSFTTWALIGILMIPVLGTSSIGLAIGLTMAIFWTGLIAMGLIWVSHAVFPDPPLAEAGMAKKKAAATLDKQRAAKHALVRTLVILPLEIYVLIGNQTSDLKILIFAAMLAQSPNLTAGAAGGRAMIIGNMFGGLVAIIIYQFLKWCPSFVFLVALFGLLGLVFGRQIFSGSNFGKLCGSGLGTVVLLIGLGTMPFGDDVDSQFYSRIFQVIIAAIYIVLAFQLIDNLAYRRDRRRELREAKQRKLLESA